MATPRKTINKIGLAHAIDEGLTERGFFEGNHAHRTVFMHYVSYLWTVDATPKYPQAIKWHVMQGCVWPAVVEAKTGLTTKSVERANAWLEAKGLIRVTRGISRHGGKPGPVDIEITLPLKDGKQLGNRTEAKMVDEYWRALELSTDIMSVENPILTVTEAVPTDMVSTPTDMVSRPTDTMSDIKRIHKEKAKETSNAPVRSLTLTSGAGTETARSLQAETAISPSGERVSTDSVNLSAAIPTLDDGSYSDPGSAGDLRPYAAPAVQVVSPRHSGVWAENEYGHMRQLKSSANPRRKPRGDNETEWDGDFWPGTTRIYGIVEGGYVRYLRHKISHETRAGKGNARPTPNEEAGYFDDANNWQAAKPDTQWREVSTRSAA